MTPIRLLARPMLASIFVAGGAQQLLDPEGHAPVARNVTEPLQEAAPELDNASTTQLVQLNGAAQVLGGILLALGKMPRLSALLLAGSLVPTTLAAHRFWEEDDPDARDQQMTQFLKNVSLLGGLIIASLDREGRPGLAWRGKHAVDHAKLAAEHAKELASLRAEHAQEVAGLRSRLAKKALSVDPGDHLRVRKELLKKQLTPDIADAKKLVDALRSDDDD